MNLGFDAKRYFHNHTGLGNYSRFVVDSLIAMYPDCGYFLYDSKAKSDNHADARAFFRTPKRFLHQKMPALWRTVRLANDLVADKIDVFHGLSNEIPLGLGAAKIKTVVTIHDLIFMRFPDTYTRIDRAIYRQKVKYACRVADKVVAVSHQTKADIVHYFNVEPKKIEVVYQGCHKQFNQKISDTKILTSVKARYNLKKRYFLCVSTISERKNQLNLVKAFHSLNLGDAFDLVLVGGKTTYQLEIEQYIFKHKIQNIKIFNVLPFEDFPALYQGSECVVYPSIFEGFGIPVLEAMHSGVPVLAADSSCLQEVLGRSGASTYFNPFSVEEIAEAMRIFNTSEDKSLYTKHYADQLRSFDAKTNTQKLMNLYQNL